MQDGATDIELMLRARGDDAAAFHELVRRYRGKDIVVRVREDGFEYDGQIHRSLSSAVRQASNRGRSSATLTRRPLGAC